MDFATIDQAISEFSGVYRRFEIKGEVNGITVIDDYAHHPTEIQATLQAARSSWNKRIVCVFQPHTYSRTLCFYKDFGASFDDADILVITDVYPAREKPIEGVSGKLIADAATQYGHKNVVYIQNKEDILNELKGILKEGDVVITMGAGDVWKIANELVKKIN